MNKKIIYSILGCSLLLTACKTTPVNSESDTNSVSDSSDSESMSSSSSESNYETIDDVSTLFETYETDSDYNYIVTYNCEVIADREYVGGWTTNYMYDGSNLQIDYESDGKYFTDYYVYDENSSQWIYYLDNGNGKYKYLDEDNEFYFNFVSNIDPFELANIDWETDFVFDLNGNNCIPTNESTMQKIGKQIFGDLKTEYWYDFKLNYSNGYITSINAISIYREATYYYTIELTEHGFATVKAPTADGEFENPYKPYLKGKETYTGISLTEQQASALNLFKNETEMNFTTNIEWTAVVEGEVTDITTKFVMESDKGNYKYTYQDNDTMTHTDYLVSQEGANPIYYADNLAGGYNIVSYGMDEYSSQVSFLYLDRVLLYGLDPENLIYDEEKGYITAKDEETEQKLCDSLFYFEGSYGGLRIYLTENEDGSFTLDKIVTSLFISDGTAYYSFVKTYSFSNINSTETITAPINA